MCEKTIFTFSFQVSLANLDLKLAPLVTVVQHCVSTKSEVSTAFLFRENRKHETDGTDCAVEKNERSYVIGEFVDGRGVPILELQTRGQLSHGQALRLLRG